MLKIIRQFSKFVPVGFLNTGIDIGIFALLTWLFGIYAGFGLILLNAIAFFIANANSFFWNKYWVFKEQAREKIIPEYFKFLATSLVALGIQSIVIYLITLMPPILVSAKLWALGAKALAVAIALAWNFIGYKFLVFKK